MSNACAKPEKRKINNSTGELIQFPLNGNSKFVESEKQRLENVKRYQSELCLNTAIELTYQLFEEIQARGIDLSHEKELDRDMLMICETIKSCLLKASNIGHPLQGITSQIIQKEDSDHFYTNWKLAVDDKNPVDPNT